MGIFNFLKKRPSQGVIEWAKKQDENMYWALNDKDNRDALQKMIKNCPQFVLEYLARIKSGKGLTHAEQIRLTDTMKSDPEYYRELWVRWTGNIDLATNEERKKWFGE